MFFFAGNGILQAKRPRLTFQQMRLYCQHNAVGTENSKKRLFFVVSA